MERYEVCRVETVKYPNMTEGYAVVDRVNEKFVGPLWSTQAEAQELRSKHREAVLIKEHWPSLDDAEVKEELQSLTLDESLTFAYAVHNASEKVARRRAGL
jgi:hypothetical protein